LPVHLSVIAFAMEAIVSERVPWPASLLLSLVIGGSFAGLTFLGHETLHGAVVHTGWLRKAVGWIGFSPFVVSPTLWIAWHNRVHHGNTNRPGIDPDAYPTLAEYEASPVLRWMTDIMAPGRRRLFGVMSLWIGFTIQSLHMLVDARRLKLLSKAEHRRAIAETLLGVALWSGLGFSIGLGPFLLCFLLPLVVANSIVMAFILTNHSLSPLTDVNDPLANSLSVTLPAWCEWLTLGFGYHVEHHIFPAMSTRHGREVRALLRSRWPGRYQSLPLGRALLALHGSPRVYKTYTILVDPRSGQECPTLEAGPELVAPVPEVTLDRHLALQNDA